MGLHTTHGCFSGPYSQFNRWRQELHKYTAPVPTRTLDQAWDAGDYLDNSSPINILMNHSDCEGEIPALVCGPLADALLAILNQMPSTGFYDAARPATERFIVGLRKAAAANEAVSFR